MYKIQYKYSLRWDIIWSYRTIKNRGWLKKKKLVIFMPNLSKMIKLWFKRPIGPDIDTDFPVTCYWRSSGTWGSYTPPDKIFICTRGLVNIEKVIRHEITHLKYNTETKKMTHEEKELYINKRQ